jgi:molybdate transport system substrate-binding protein
MDALQQANLLINDTRLNLLANRLVLITAENGVVLSDSISEIRIWDSSITH